MPAILKKIFYSGVQPEMEDTVRISVVLSNLIAFVLFFVNILLLVLIPQNHNFYAFLETCTALLLFSIPFLPVLKCRRRDIQKPPRCPVRRYDRK